MGKKRVHAQQTGETEARPPPGKSPFWCYYCGYEAKDETTLIQHQAAKHFACPFCDVGSFGRLCQSLSGLVSHVRRSHRKDLDKVPGAMQGRDSVSMNIFGMSGIPQDALDARREEMGITEPEPAPLPAPLPVPTPVALEQPDVETEDAGQQYAQMGATKLAKPKHPGAMDTMNKVLEVATSNSEQDSITKALLAAAATNAPSSAGDTARIITAVLKAATASKNEPPKAAPPLMNVLSEAAPQQAMAEIPKLPGQTQTAATWPFEQHLLAQASVSAHDVAAEPAPKAVVDESEPYDPYEGKSLEEVESSLALVPVGSGDARSFTPGTKVRLQGLKIHYRLNGAVGSVMMESGKLPQTVKVMLETGHDFTVRLRNIEIFTDDGKSSDIGNSHRDQRSRSPRRKQHRWDPEEKFEDKVPAADQKPSMCMPFTEGLCKKGAECPFAHNLRELQPGGFKPRLCPSYEQGECPRGKVCVFAHSAKELPPNFKTVVCASFKQGLCRKHSICTFAHGDDELKFYQNLMGTTAQPQPAAVGMVTTAGGVPSLNLRALTGSASSITPLALRPLRPVLALPGIPGVRPVLPVRPALPCATGLTALTSVAGGVAVRPTVQSLLALRQQGLQGGTMKAVGGMPSLLASPGSVGTMPGSAAMTPLGSMIPKGLGTPATSGILARPGTPVRLPLLGLPGSLKPGLNPLAGSTAVPGTSISMGAGPAAKRRCVQWAMGGCTFGEACAFSHGA